MAILMLAAIPVLALVPPIAALAIVALLLFALPVADGASAVGGYRGEGKIDSVRPARSSSSRSA
jgi:hypothetical protein